MYACTETFFVSFGTRLTIDVVCYLYIHSFRPKICNIIRRGEYVLSLNPNISKLNCVLPLPKLQTRRVNGWKIFFPSCRNEETGRHKFRVLCNFPFFTMFSRKHNKYVDIVCSTMLLFARIFFSFFFFFLLAVLSVWFGNPEFMHYLSLQELRNIYIHVLNKILGTKFICQTRM